MKTRSGENMNNPISNLECSSLLMLALPATIADPSVPRTVEKSGVRCIMDFHCPGKDELEPALKKFKTPKIIRLFHPSSEILNYLFKQKEYLYGLYLESQTFQKPEGAKFLESGIPCGAVVNCKKDLEDLESCLSKMSLPLIARGNESGGFVGPLSAFVLFQLMKEQSNYPFFLEGGLDQTAAVAALASGSQGIILGSAAWGFPEMGHMLSKFAKSLRAHEVIQITDQKGNGFSLACRAKPDLIKLRNRILDLPLEQWISQFPEGFVPAGQDVEFAASNADKFSSLNDFLIDTVKKLTAASTSNKKSFNSLSQSTLGKELNFRLPIIQGPMARITESPDFLKAIYQSGAAPVAAFSSLPPYVCSDILERCEKFGFLPGIGIIGLEIQSEVVDKQVSVALKHTVPFILLAAPRQQLIEEFLEKGIRIITHAPHRLAIVNFYDVGARYLILEGRESGGHIGPLSSLVLWQIALEETHRRGWSDVRLIFAGGIGTRSGVNFIEALIDQYFPEGGLTWGIQLGTAYLTTQEIVETCAMSLNYRNKILSSELTIITGESVGLRARQIATPFVASILDDESDALRKGLSLTDRRNLFEKANMGNLSRASKSREGEDGCFMAGEAIALLDKVKTIDQLHNELMGQTIGPENAKPESKISISETNSAKSDIDNLQTKPNSAKFEEENKNLNQVLGGNATGVNDKHGDFSQNKIDIDSRGSNSGSKDFEMDLVQMLTEKNDETSVKCVDSLQNNDDKKEIASKISKSESESPGKEGFQGLTENKDTIAVIGMGCVFPGSSDPNEYFGNILAKRNFIQQMPEKRLDSSVFYHPDKSVPVTTYSRIGAFLGEVNFDPTTYRVPPRAADAMDLAQKLALICARQALLDSGYLESGKSFSHEKVGVMIGNSMGGAAAAETLRTVYFHEFRVRLGLLAEELGCSGLINKMTENILSEYPVMDINEDTLPGELGSLIAGRVASTFDLHGPNFTMDAACGSSLAAVITAVNALRQKQVDLVLTGGVDTQMDPGAFIKFAKVTALSSIGSFPFDHRADGFVMGEGCGLILLKRLEDAIRDNDQIYAVLLGIGQSSDGKGKGITAPNPEGQRRTIERAWTDAGHSFSEIGYLEGHGTGTRVGDEIELGSAASLLPKASELPFKIPIGSVKANIGHLKAAAGIAGLMKAIWVVNRRVIPPQANFEKFPENWTEKELPFEVPTQERKFSGNSFLVGVSSFGFGGTDHHIVVGEAPCNRVDRTIKIPEVVESVPDTKSKSLKAGKVAIVFPGQGSQYLNMLETWKKEPEFAETLKEADAIFRCSQPGFGSLTDYIYPSTSRMKDESTRDELESKLQNTLIAQPAILTVCIGLLRVAKKRGLKFDIALGHSLGEYAALHAAETLSFSSILEAVCVRAQYMTAFSGNDFGAMGVIGLPVSKIQPEIEKTGGYVICANLNSPVQTVISGDTEAVEELLERFYSRGIFTRRLNVSAAFHSRIVAGAAPQFKNRLLGLFFQIPRIPIPSNLNGEWYPIATLAAAKGSGSPSWQSPENWRETMIDMLGRQLMSPVDFINQIERTYNAGVRTFVEIGPKNTLSHLIKEILGTRPHQCLHTDHPKQNSRDLLSKALNAASVSRAFTQPNQDLTGLAISTYFLDSSSKCAPTTPTSSATASGSKAALPTTKGPDPNTTPVSNTPLEETVLNVIEEISGYPRSMIKPELDLEADLGIDTLKIFEIAGRLRNFYPDKAKQRLGLSQLRTMKSILETFRETQNGSGKDSPADPIKESAKLLHPEAAPSTLKRHEVKVVHSQLDPKNFDLPEWLNGATITIKSTGIHGWDKALFQAAVSLKMSPRFWKPDSNDFDLLENGTIPSDLIDSDVYVHSIPSEKFGRKVRRSFFREEIMGLFLICRCLGKRLKSLVIFTDLGGEIGRAPFHKSGAGFLSGFSPAFCLSLEKDFPGLQARTIDLTSFSFSLALKGLTFGFAKYLPALIGIPNIHGEKITFSEVRPTQLTIDKQSIADLKVALGPDRVILATGGGSGITARLLLGLAKKFKPKILILGRAAERNELVGQLRKAGSEVWYLSCDLADGPAVDRTADLIKRAVPRINLLIHGAGLEISRNLANKTPEEINRVYRIKVAGLVNLLDAIGEESVDAVVSFSSVASLFGNPGQVDYAAANGFINQFIGRGISRFLSIAWSAWDQVGMASRGPVNEILRSHDVEFINPKQGEEFFIQELLNFLVIDPVKHRTVAYFGRLGSGMGPSIKQSQYIKHIKDEIFSSGLSEKTTSSTKEKIQDTIKQNVSDTTKEEILNSAKEKPIDSTLERLPDIVQINTAEIISEKTPDSETEETQEQPQEETSEILPESSFVQENIRSALQENSQIENQEETSNPLQEYLENENQEKTPNTLPESLKSETQEQIPGTSLENFQPVTQEQKTVACPENVPHEVKPTFEKSSVRESIWDKTSDEKTLGDFIIDPEEKTHLKDHSISGRVFIPAVISLEGLVNVVKNAGKPAGEVSKDFAQDNPENKDSSIVSTIPSTWISFEKLKFHVPIKTSFRDPVRMIVQKSEDEIELWAEQIDERGVSQFLKNKQIATQPEQISSSENQAQTTSGEENLKNDEIDRDDLTSIPCTRKRLHLSCKVKFESPAPIEIKRWCDEVIRLQILLNHQEFIIPLKWEEATREDLNKVLFHGPAFQVLNVIDRWNDKVLAATPEDWRASLGHSELAGIDHWPFFLESALHGAGVFSLIRVASRKFYLPSSVEQIDINVDGLKQNGSQKVFVEFLEKKVVQSDFISLVYLKYNVFLTDENGIPLIRLKNLQMVAGQDEPLEKLSFFTIGAPISVGDHQFMAVKTSDALALMQSPENLYEFLTKEEDALFKQLEYDKRRIEWLAGRIASKILIRNFVFQKVAYEIPFSFFSISSEGETPKIQISPEVSDEIRALLSGLNVSISHAAELGASVIFPGKVGLDVEGMRKLASSDLPLFLTSEELQEAPQGEEIAFWTAKEAVSKVLGLGFDVQDFKLIVLKNFGFCDPYQAIFSPTQQRFTLVTFRDRKRVATIAIEEEIPTTSNPK
ncbi:MAG: SDR family NAD(P)-dependent oxidoreductase [Candidatus Riflebacteria bacterium]|nr:SDR family NAD(P)-dependent oxidoreductase [Candidatus Riflebacteria bacterium]